MFTLIIGGSASGKSEYAEQQVLTLPGQRVYIATLEPWDDECRKRIRKHQNARAQRGFITLECYRGLSGLTVPGGSNVLLDGLGNLVAGELYSPQGLRRSLRGPNTCWSSAAILPWWPTRCSPAAGITRATPCGICGKWVRSTAHWPGGQIESSRWSAGFRIF